MKQPKVYAIACDRIDPPDVQLRASMDPDRLHDLAQSIAARGLLSPILLRPTGKRFKIIAGNRRFLAVQSLGRITINAFVTAGNAARDIGDSLHENLFRENLTPMEEAALIAHLRETDGMTTEQTARALSHSTAWIESRTALLEIHPLLQQALHAGTIGLAAARVLAPIADEQYLTTVLEAARSHGLTERHALEWGRQYELYRTMKEAGAPAEMPTLALVASEAAKTPCDFCHQLTYINTTKILRICFDCLQALQTTERAQR